MSLTELLHYDETVFNLASYLLVAPERHRQVIKVDPDAALSYSELRQLHHYSQALMATGLPRYSEEFDLVVRRFQASLPFSDYRPDDDVLDSTALMRLEGLMHVCPDDPDIKKGLRQLIEQRTNDYHFYIARTSRTQIGCTLWAVRVLTAARRIYGETGLLSDVELRRSLIVIFPQLAHIQNMIRRHRDLSLALGLYFELAGRLEPIHEAYLYTLVRESEKSDNLWGVRRRAHVHGLLNLIYRHRRYNAHHHQRAYDDPRDKASMIETQEADTYQPALLPGFQALDGRNKRRSAQNRKNVGMMKGQRANVMLSNVIITTCHVIKNLAPLTKADKYDFLEIALKHSMELWWNQLAGKDATYLLREVFTDDANYIDVLCNTVTAAHAYSGVTLKERSFLKDLRNRAERFKGDNQTENIQAVLRSWLNIKVGEPQSLELGMSGSTVVRIRPEIIMPTVGKLSPSDMSLIVKYGSTDDINREKRNYLSIPHEIQSCFVRIPDKDYPIGDRTFLVMEDLDHFSTIYEMVESEAVLKLPVDYIVRKFLNFMEKVHRGNGAAAQYATPKHLRDLYIAPMLQDIEKLSQMSEYIQHKIPVNAETRTHFATIEMVGDMIDDLSAGGRIAAFERFPLALMHGDLHTRNIMARYSEKGKLQFRLIDLEKLQTEGDVAIDAGQLIVDLDLLHHNIQRSNLYPLLQHLQELRHKIGKAYPEFAKARKDTSFDTRFELASSRAYIRVIKSRFKTAQHYLDTYRIEEATQIVMDSLAMIESARHHLQQVYDYLDARQG